MMSFGRIPCDRIPALPKALQFSKLLALGILSAFLLCSTGFADPTASSTASPSAAVIPMPPMGWSSWNSFSNTIDSQIVMAQARAMVSSGMQKGGYEYINIDEGWWLGARNSDGSFVIDPKAWPALAPGEKAGDMSNIVRYIHSLGLKAGIYTDAGKDGCSMYPDLGPKLFHTGSEGHYQQDFLQFAKWGFDYVKVDWCGGNKENLDPAVQYAEIAQAISRAAAITGHRLYFSICNWGKQSPWAWAPNVGGAPADIWRTSGDIVAPIVAGHEHADRKASFVKVLSNFDQANHPAAEHTGYYNDPDMMVLGMPGLTEEQNRLHMALWAMSGAPLLVGADLTKLNPSEIAILTNRRVLAIDQDPAGLQAIKVSEPAPGLQVWSKALAAPGHRAVLLLNRTASAQPIAVKWSDLGLVSAAPGITNAWTGEQLPSAPNAFRTEVAAGDGMLLLVSGREDESGTEHYTPTSPVSNNTDSCCASLEFSGVQSPRSIARIQIVYRNSDQAPEYASLSVNGEETTRIAFPPTGGADGYVWIQSALPASPAGNNLTFSAICGPKPAIESITVH